MHRANSVYEPIPPDNFSSCHRQPGAVTVTAKRAPVGLDVQADREVLLARCEIAEAYYRGSDQLALDMLASSSLRLYGHVITGGLSASIFSTICRNAPQILAWPSVARMTCRRPLPTGRGPTVR